MTPLFSVEDLLVCLREIRASSDRVANEQDIDKLQVRVRALEETVTEVLQHLDHWRAHSGDQLREQLRRVEQSIETLSCALEKLVQDRQARMSLMQQRPQLWRLLRTLFCYVHTRPEVVVDLIQTVKTM
mmetsp:Transcript_41380/g.104338  ORF Transcript_41380/g.104338 Transcript_41380/m.104338 type:complete len:129 (-) Transcript_41380:31-417(-)